MPITLINVYIYSNLGSHRQKSHRLKNIRISINSTYRLKKAWAGDYKKDAAKSYWNIDLTNLGTSSQLNQLEFSAAEFAVDEVVVVARGKWSCKIKQKKKMRKNTTFSLHPVLGKAFPVPGYLLSLFGYACADRCARWVAVCIQVQLQASFCSKRLPCIFSLCILERLKDQD